MYGKMKEHLSNALAEIKEAGLYKEERIIESPQSAAIEVKGKEVLNFCANNYLGLSNHPRLTLMVESLSHCSPIRMLSSLMRSTMPQLLMVYAFVRQSVIAMQMQIWLILSVVCRRHRNSVSASLLLMVCSQWMVTLLQLTKFATSLRSITLL